MRRREFLLSSAALAAPPQTSVIHTVLGPIKPAQLGVCLPHEHLFSIFGDEPAEQASYDLEKLFQSVPRYVNSVKALGCTAIADATAAWFGRAPELLARISRMSRVHILTNTGFYGAAAGRYIPKSAHEESLEQIAAHWTAEARDGIGSTAIRPGFIKLGVDNGPLSPVNRKLFEAACLTHRATGLLITVHTSGAAEAASQQLDILKQYGVKPEAWVWIHANNCPDTAALKSAAEAGAWLSFDGIAPESIERHIELVSMMKSLRRLNQVLLSHDGNSFRAGGRPMKPYSALFTHFIPALRAAKFTADEIRRLTTDNPARAFTATPRLRP